MPALVGVVVAVCILFSVCFFLTSLIVELFDPAYYARALDLSWNDYVLTIYVITAQHGFLYKPYLSVPILMFFLWLGTNGLDLVHEANEVVFRGKGTWIFADAFLIYTRICVLGCAGVMLLLMILPYGDFLAKFVAIAGCFLFPLGVLPTLVWIAFSPRLVLAAQALLAAGDPKDLVEAYGGRHMSKSGDGTKTGELLPPRAEDPHGMKSAGHADLPFSNLGIFGSARERYRYRARAKVTADYRGTVEEATKTVIAHTGLVDAKLDHVRTVERSKDINQTLQHDRDLRAAEATRASEERRVAEHNQRIAAQDRERRLQESQAGQAKGTSPGRAGDPLDGEMDAALGVRMKARRARAKVEREIMDLLGGVPEERATSPLRKIIAEMRGEVEQMIKDAGLE